MRETEFDGDDDQSERKSELFRILNPRWHLYRAALLRETGYSWEEIAEALDRHFTTVQKYCKAGKAELEVEGTLHFWLSDRVRKLLQKYDVGTMSSCGPEQAMQIVRMYYESKFLKGVGPGTVREILDAIEDLNDSRTASRSLVGERPSGAARA